jgi:hypothetical protein
MCRLMPRIDAILADATLYFRHERSTRPRISAQNPSQQLACDEQEERAAVTWQRRASHKDHLPVHEARDLVALQRMRIK